MATYSKAKVRNITVTRSRVQKESRYDLYQQLALLVAAAGIERAAVYMKESTDGREVKVKVYAQDDTVEFFIVADNDEAYQVEAAICEIWGESTYREARQVTGLGRAGTAPEAVEVVPPDPNGVITRKTPQKRAERV